MVTKWLGAHAKVLVSMNPPRGIDINGKREIYWVMVGASRVGSGNSRAYSDNTEALEMSYRINVLRRGSICKEHQRGESQETDILREAIGQVAPASS